MARRVRISTKGRFTLFKIGRLEICWWKDYRADMFYRKPQIRTVKPHKEA